MYASFDTILVPIDFSTATYAAVEKALELGSRQATIHLLYVSGGLSMLPLFPAYFLSKASGFFKKEDEDYSTKLLSLKSMIQQKAPEVRVEIAKVENLDVKKALIDKAVKVGANLIILGRSYYGTGFPFIKKSLPGQLAKEAPCAVLTVASKSASGIFKTVIVPLSRNATYSNMSVMGALSGTNRLNIHLVILSDYKSKAAENVSSSFLKIYQWLKTSFQCQVHCKEVSGRNKAEATLKYAKSVNADVILIDPEVQVETFWPGQNIISFLQSKSEIPVLAVQPAGALANH